MKYIDTKPEPEIGENLNRISEEVYTAMREANDKKGFPGIIPFCMADYELAISSTEAAAGEPSVILPATFEDSLIMNGGKDGEIFWAVVMIDSKALPPIYSGVVAPFRVLDGTPPMLDVERLHTIVMDAQNFDVKKMMTERNELRENLELHVIKSEEELVEVTNQIQEQRINQHCGHADCDDCNERYGAPGTVH